MTEIAYKIYVAGYCMQFEAASYRGAKWRIVKYPAICALLEHPTQGLMLFDTGYADRFARETRQLPYALYRWLTPVRLKKGESLVEQLRADGISPSDIDSVIVSHFHADHIAGLSDFPDSTFYCNGRGYAETKGLEGIKALRKAFVPGLMPADFADRMVDVSHSERVKLESGLEEFGEGYDILGDQSLLVINLPGHANNQIGVLFRDKQGVDTLLCADAAWSTAAIRNNIGPGILGYHAVEDRTAHDDTLARLHRAAMKNPELKMIPSHCQEIWDEIRRADNV